MSSDDGDAYFESNSPSDESGDAASREGRGEGGGGGHDATASSASGGGGGGAAQAAEEPQPPQAPPTVKKRKKASKSKAAGGGSKWLSFDAARTLVRALKLGSQREWQEYSKSGERPINIPSHPDTIYRDAGWVSWPDWLGYEEKKKMTQGGALPFDAARALVRAQKLGSWKEWKEYSKSVKRPSNIPGMPDKVYRDDGWVSWPDWLGYEKKVMLKGGGLPFEEARAIVRALKLGNHKEWKEYSRSGKRPSNIPSAPDQTYRDAGWISMPDWLGYGGSSSNKKKRKKGGASDAAEEDDPSERDNSEEDMEEGEDEGEEEEEGGVDRSNLHRLLTATELRDWLGQ